ncbi:MAG: pentapeptide repeat-containing protein, partial [Rhodobacter sp.]|nr:pentapeptide repeat-containing protein [Rhodobacter sp.]
MDQAARTELEEKLKLEPGDLDPLIQEERGEIAAAFRDRLAMPEAADDSDLAAVTRLLMKADESGAELPVAESFIDLRDIHFSNTVVLEKWIFSGPAFFSSATFSGVVDFSNEGFGGTTSFAGVRFTGAVPKFYGREFHQDTDIPISPGNWPDINAKGAGEAKRAYTRLRQVMNGLHKPDAEAFFGRQELRCDAFDGGQLNRWMNWGYGFVSEYGHSVGRPIAGLAVLIAVFWGILGSYLKHGKEVEGVAAIWQGLGLSIANTFPYLGFHRRYLDDVELDHLDGWVEWLGGVQTVLGGVLLFFLLLGLRNR